MRPLAEVDVARPAVAYLRALGWKVYQEVEADEGIADIVATRRSLLAVAEVKTRLNNSVVSQAARWRRHSNLCWVVTPWARRNEVRDFYMREHGIGWLIVGQYESEVRERIGAALRRHRSTALERLLQPEHETFSEAGSMGAPRWTPFKETCRALAQYVALHPGTAMKAAVEAIKHHYSSHAAARGSLSKWIKNNQVPGVEWRSEDGKTWGLYPASGADRR